MKPATLVPAIAASVLTLWSAPLHAQTATDPAAAQPPAVSTTSTEPAPSTAGSTAATTSAPTVSTAGVASYIARLEARHPNLASSGNLESLVRGLRTGSAVTLTATQGTTTSSSTFTPPTQPMGYGNITRALTLATRQLAAAGIAEPTPQQLQAALMGGTVTTPNGSVAMQGVLQLRSSGMGWGQIAHTVGVQPGMAGKATSAGSAPASSLTTAGGGSATGSVRPTGGASGRGIVTAAGTAPGMSAYRGRAGAHKAGAPVVAASAPAGGRGVVNGVGIGHGHGAGGRGGKH